MHKKACANVLTGGSFSANLAKGTIVVADERQTDRHWLLIRCGQRNATRRPRHSRFHIHFLHLTQALHVMSFKFSDGTASKSFAAHNQDQDLRSAMRNSTVWIYELFAKEIGEDKARRYLKQIDYGNADPSTSNGDYWIDGKSCYRGTRTDCIGQEALS